MQVEENEAVARGRNLPVSRKHAREVARFIDGEPVAAAKRKLQDVVDEERPVPMKRHSGEQAHKKGSMAGGRYPVKTAEEMLTVLESAESNATYAGMDAEKLAVTGVMVNQGNRYYTPKRHRGRKPKAAHITIKVGER